MNPNGSSFLDLPPEIRRTIYEYLFTFTRSCKLGKRKFVIWGKRGVIGIKYLSARERRILHEPDDLYYRLGGNRGCSQTESPWGLVATCKAIHEEAIAAFYQSNVFHVVEDVTYCTRSAFRLPPFVDLGRVRHLTVTVRLEGCRKSRLPEERPLFAEYFMDFTSLKMLASLQTFRLQVCWMQQCVLCKDRHYPGPNNEAWLATPFLIDVVTGALKNLRRDVKVAFGSMALATKLTEDINKELNAEGEHPIPLMSYVNHALLLKLGQKYIHLRGKNITP